MMNKTIFILGALLMANVAFAAWSEPSATPPNGNVPAPINVSGNQQVKKGSLGAYEFCLYNTSGKLNCLGDGSGSGNYNFPWTIDGVGNVINSNSGGNVVINGKLCLPNTSYCISSWSEIKSYITGFVKLGSSRTANNLTKWQDSETITNSNLSESGPNLYLGGEYITKWSDIISKYGGSDSGSVGPGTTNKISKFISADKIGDSNITDNGSVVEVTSVPLKPSAGFIIPKFSSDVNDLEEGAMWLNTSISVF